MSDIDTNLDDKVAALVAKQLEAMKPPTLKRARCWVCWKWTLETVDGKSNEKMSCSNCRQNSFVWNADLTLAFMIKYRGGTGSFLNGTAVAVATHLGSSITELFDGTYTVDEVAAAWDQAVAQPRAKTDTELQEADAKRAEHDYKEARRRAVAARDALANQVADLHVRLEKAEDLVASFGEDDD